MPSLKKVCVTGGLGFIGSNLCQALVIKGYSVKILDAKLDPYGWNLANIKEIVNDVELIVGDVRDPNAVKKAIADVDAVFDLAAQVSHTISMQKPFLDLDLNNTGSLQILEAVKDLSKSGKTAPKLIFGSTRSVLGKVPEHLKPEQVNEDILCLPTDIVGVNKLAIEHYYRIYAQAYGLNTVSIRINNTYGPRSQVKTDDYNVLNWFIRRAVLNEPMILHGDGLQKRDYNYVKDVAEALVLAMEVSTQPGEHFWLGSGKPPVAFIEVLKMVVQLSQTKSKLEFIDRPKNRAAIEVGNFGVSIEKAQKHLGWIPKTDLSSGLQKTIDFYQKRIGEYVSVKKSKTSSEV